MKLDGRDFVREGRALGDKALGPDDFDGTEALEGGSSYYYSRTLRLCILSVHGDTTAALPQD